MNEKSKQPIELLPQLYRRGSMLYRRSARNSKLYYPAGFSRTPDYSSLDTYGEFVLVEGADNTDTDAVYSETVKKRHDALLEKLDDIVLFLQSKKDHQGSGLFLKLKSLLYSSTSFIAQGSGLGLSSDDKISYPKLVAHFDNDKRRVESKIKPFLKFLIKSDLVQGYTRMSDFTEADLEFMATTWGEFKSITDMYEFIPCVGQEIIEPYSHANIGSCMAGNARVEMHLENPQSCTVVKIVYKETGKFAGRVNVYTLKNGQRVADYAYPRTGLHIRAFADWANENNVLLLNPSNYDDRPNLVDEGCYIEYRIPDTFLDEKARTAKRIYLDSFLILCSDTQAEPGSICRFYQNEETAAKNMEPIIYEYSSISEFAPPQRFLNPKNKQYEYCYCDEPLETIMGRVVPSKYAEFWSSYFATHGTKL